MPEPAIRISDVVKTYTTGAVKVPVLKGMSASVDIWKTCCTAGKIRVREIDQVQALRHD